MSNPFAKYQTDIAKEREGVEVKIDDMIFTVRRAGGNNRAYRYALAVAAQRRRTELQGEATIELFNVQEDILQDAFSECVVAGWQNVEGWDGEPLEFSPENCRDLLAKCPTIWDAIKAAAIDDDSFRIVQEDGELLGK